MSLHSSCIISPTPAFSGYLADTRESRRIHYRIRYQVYCERKGFEDNAVLRKRGLERDAYDEHALPFIFRDEHDGHWRGTARLVIRGATPLPVEASGALPDRFCAGYAPGSVAELSRLAALTPPTRHGRDRWALLRATLGSVLSCAEWFGIEELLFLTVPSLARVINRMGIPIEPVGQPIEHRGVRQAFVGQVKTALTTLVGHGIEPAFESYSRLGDHGRERLLA